MPRKKRTAAYTTGDRVTVATYCVNRDGHDANGRAGVVRGGPRGYGDFYDVAIPGWGAPALLTAGELRPAEAAEKEKRARE